MEMLMVLLFILLHHPLTAYSANDGEILIAIRESIDPKGSLAEWNFTTQQDYCEWDHVTCAFNTNRVGELYLNNTKLSGSVPSLFANLSQLEYLDLSSNNLNGHIPDQLGDLSNLQYLFLNNNSLSGVIPMTLTRIPSLYVLDLSNNHLWGEIPTNGSFAPRNGSFAGFEAASFKNNPGLCGVPLNKTC